MLAAAGVEPRVDLIQGDMRDFQLERRFGMAFCAINSFMHLETQADQLQALRCWRQHLEPGGILVLDLFPPHPSEMADDDGRLIMQGTWQDHETGATVVKQYSRAVDLATQVMHVQFIYDEVSPDGAMRRTLAPFVMRYLGRFEAELLLDKAGFAVEAVYGSWDLDLFESASERRIFVAERK